MAVLILFSIGIVYISTAGFYRWVGLDGFFNCMLYLIPAIVLIIFSGRAYLQNRASSGASLSDIVTWCLVILLMLAFLFHYMVTNLSYLDDRVTAEETQVTSDGKYEYRLEFVNAFERRAKARLYLKDIGNGEETYIEIGVDTSRVKMLFPLTERWTKLQPTIEPNTYILEMLLSEYSGSTFEVNVSENVVRYIEE